MDSLGVESLLPFWTPQSEAEFGSFRARLQMKVRYAVDKRIERAAADASAGYGRCWKRLALLLARLAPDRVGLVGPAVTFHVQDGPYRRQVFALDDRRPMLIQVYLPDIRAAARERGLPSADGMSFVGYSAQTPGLPEFCRPMVGWGRLAVRTGVGPLAEEPQLQTLTRLCELAAEMWALPAGDTKSTAAVPTR